MIDLCAEFLHIRQQLLSCLVQLLVCIYKDNRGIITVRENIYIFTSASLSSRIAHVKWMSCQLCLLCFSLAFVVAHNSNLSANI